MAATDHAWIVGGQDTEISTLPWQVSLQDSLGHLCGGAIIADEWVLTANHCVFSSQPLTVLAGVTRLSEQDTGQRAPVVEIYRTPGFSDPLAGKDLAVLHLGAKLDLSGPNVRAIEIVTAADEAAGLTAPGVEATVSGWGALSAGDFSFPDTLQSVNVPIISNEEADAAYVDVEVTADQIAAAILGVGGKDACQGDSGGPMVVPDGAGSFKLAGTVSWGYGCAEPNSPGMYARVASFEQFINDAMAGNVVIPPASCAASCGGIGTDGFCYCDEICSQNGDCCPDFVEQCPDVGTGGSCEGNCGGQAGSCFCDDICAENGDCCADYNSLCLGTPDPEPEPEPEPEPAECCRVCTTGKACGNSCIAKTDACHKEPGCACDLE